MCARTRNFTHAVENLVDGAFFNSGQSCCGIGRIYVDETLYERFVAEFVKLTNAYKLGNPTDQSVNLGPLVRTRAADEVRRTIDAAVKGGARALIDAGRFAASRPGTPYLAPQVLVDVRQDMPVMQEETFGPLVSILKVRGDEEAIACMNDSRYGLTASVWTSDDASRACDRRAHRNRHVVHESLRLSGPGPRLGRGEGFRARLHLVAGRVRTPHPAQIISPAHRGNTMTTASIHKTELTGRWHFPTSIRFGAGRIRELPAACRELGSERPLLVTDTGLAKLPVVAQSVELCRAAGLGCEVYSEVQANPVEANVTQGVDKFRAGGHDGVIAFGGGSALDVGKAIALMVGQTRPIWDFEDKEDWYTRVNVAGMAPVVAVPTTAGTGSEVGRCSVLTDLRDHTKKLIFHPRILPAIVIEDPELGVGLPAKLTAAVGMDALSHNLEAFCGSAYHPLADGIAVEGIRLIKEWLPAAVRDGADVEARAHMLIASTMGATAFQKGLGAMHSLSHPCSANLNTHHGLTNAVVMPYVLVYNAARSRTR